MPVELRAPKGGGHGHCFNGGFEEGTFEGWEIGIGTNEDGARPPTTSPTFFSEGVFDDIIQGDGAFDPGAGFALTPPSGGIFIAKLGTPNLIGKGVRSLAYDFNVSSDFPSLDFNYAVVLQDGNEIQPHQPNQQPFFYWRVLDEDGNVLDCENCENDIVADVNDEFFLTDGFLVYKEWTCVSIDLSAYINQTLTIEFYVAGCSLDGHYAYAYLDGLCATDIEPQINFSINEFYCQNQTITAEATEYLGANRYSWEVCRIYDDGSPPQCYFTPIQIGYDVPPFDVLGFFFDSPAHNAGALSCGDRFRVKLSGYNDCVSGIAEEVKEFTYVCTENEVSYPDIAFCGGDEDIQIVGSTDCNNCTFEWTPAQYLNNSTSSAPVILGSLNTLALSQTYEVKMINEAGCLYQEEVRIFRTSEIIGAVELEAININRCEQEFIATVTLDMAIHSDEIQVVFSVYGQAPQGIYVGNPNVLQVYQRRIFTGELISSPGEFATHVFRIPETFLTRFNYEVDVRVSIGNLPEDMVTASGNDCLLSQYFEVAAGKYHGSINVYMANGFSPNGDGINDDYGPLFHPTESNVFAAGMKIFNRWGGQVFYGSYEAPDGLTVLGTEQELRWDGNNTLGEPHSQGVYTWLIDYANCDFPFEGCMDCNIWGIDNGECGTCDDENHYGDVTLVR